MFRKVNQSVIENYGSPMGLTLRRPTETNNNFKSWYFRLQVSENKKFFYPTKKFLWPREDDNFLKIFDFFVRFLAPHSHMVETWSTTFSDSIFHELQLFLWVSIPEIWKRWSKKSFFDVHSKIFVELISKIDFFVSF